MLIFGDEQDLVDFFSGPCEFLGDIGILVTGVHQKRPLRNKTLTHLSVSSSEGESLVEGIHVQTDEW